MIRPFDRPLKAAAGFLVLKGNLFDAAIMKTSVIGEEFRARYLSNPDDPEAFEGRVVVFDGPEDYHHRIDDPSLDITQDTLLVMRGAGPVGYPGAAEVVNMRPPAQPHQGGRLRPALPRGRAAIGHLGLALDPQRLPRGGGGRRPRAAAHGRPGADRPAPGHRRHALAGNRDRRAPQGPGGGGGYAYPASQTPWQAMQRAVVGQMHTGAILEGAEAFQRIAQTKGLPRDNH